MRRRLVMKRKYLSDDTSSNSTCNSNSSTNSRSNSSSTSQASEISGSVSPKRAEKAAVTFQDIQDLLHL